MNKSEWQQDVIPANMVYKLKFVIKQPTAKELVEYTPCGNIFRSRAIETRYNAN